VALKLVPGLYESLINRFIEDGIVEAETVQLLAERRPLDEGDSHAYFAQYLADRIRSAFASLPNKDRLEKQVELANAIVSLLSEHTPDAFHLDAFRINTAELLRSVSFPGLLAKSLERADTPLSASCLMTGTRQDPTLVSQSLLLTT
jgi:predicted nucleic acid-binding protein